MADLSLIKIGAVDRLEGASLLGVDGALELITVGKVGTVATGDLMQAAKLLPTSVAIGQKLEQSTQGK
jgi:hypothetical protein